ncbi:MAG: serine/threonine protein kinase [Myxococcota bacterium]|nr:serine/threonine protein kinase [Myxococcota bacterium]
MSTSPPIEVPKHRLLKLIGEGGFGQVWSAERESDKQLVAIKILHLELVRSIDALTRFQREIEAIQRLEHPNVVRALDHGTLGDGRPYVVLEYVEGPNLREVIHERRFIPPPEVLQILEPLCDALALAHDAGLVHRDVKASNVILGRTSDDVLRPVLLDFGLVKLLDQTGPGLTSSRSMLGTPAAMAPEQMRGLPVDARTDVYALGLLAYHMLTGQPAFTGGPGVVQSYLQIHGPRPRPSAKIEIDPAIDEPILKALATDPKDRPPTTRDFIEALRRAISPPESEQSDVIVLYVEGPAAAIAAVTQIVSDAGLIVAIAAPDSMLAVAPRDGVDVAKLLAALRPLENLHGAVGASTAAIRGKLVDGPALDVESWAPYPLAAGLWVAAGV